jgi:mannose-6-phosphate isomerase-like protein (cupin superfamily)
MIMPTTEEKKEEKPIAVSPGEGKQLNVLGEVVTCKVTGDDTAGAYTAVEEVTPVSGGQPLHVHQDEDEMLYILDGEYEVQNGDRTFKAGRGSVVAFPKTIPHRFQNVATTPSKLLATFTPGGFERFFEEASEISAEKPDMEKLTGIFHKYHLELLPS